jgi:hypothetical protein
MVKKQSIKNKDKRKRKTQKGGTRGNTSGSLQKYLGSTKRNPQRGYIINENRIILDTLKSTNNNLYIELVAKIRAASVKDNIHPTPEILNKLIKQTINDYQRDPDKYHRRWQHTIPFTIEQDNTINNVDIGQVNSAPLTDSELLALFNPVPVEEPSRDTRRMRQLGPKRTRSANSTKNSTKSKSKSKSKRASV